MAAVRRGEGRPGTQRAHDSSERLRRCWGSLARTCLKGEVRKQSYRAIISAVRALLALLSPDSVDICSVINIKCTLFSKVF